jgi:hypothetical protein
MRCFSACLISLLLPFAVSAQPRTVDHTKARLYLNEEVIVEGPVARVERGGAGALWFSLGKPHPSSTVVIVVPAEFSSSFGDPRSYEGATIRAQGRLSTGEASGIGTDRSGGVRLQGPIPRSPFIVLDNPSRLIVVSPPKPKEKP